MLKRKKSALVICGIFRVGLIILLGCAGGGAKSQADKEPLKTYKVGDTVEYKGHTVTLNSVVREKDIYLVINLTINNTGTKNFDVAPETLLKVEDGQGRQGEFYNYYVYGKESLGGTLRPGESMSGKTAFKIAPDATGIKIYYQPPDEAKVMFETEL
jgi:hypothetical protein